ncbi:unnamed protein product [Linum trigynum]
MATVEATLTQAISQQFAELRAMIADLPQTAIANEQPQNSVSETAEPVLPEEIIATPLFPSTAASPPLRLVVVEQPSKESNPPAANEKEEPGEDWVATETTRSPSLQSTRRRWLRFSHSRHQ